MNRPGVVPATGDDDLVTAMNALLHILDDARFAAALRNLGGAVAVGGWLLLAEPILTRSEEPALRPGASPRARLLARYTEVLEPAGFVLEAIAASTGVGANPIERGQGRFGPYLRIWAWASRWSKRGRRWARLVGMILRALDPVLLRTGDAPSGRLALFRRTG